MELQNLQFIFVGLGNYSFLNLNFRQAVLAFPSVLILLRSPPQFDSVASTWAQNLQVAVTEKQFEGNT